MSDKTDENTTSKQLMVYLPTRQNPYVFEGQSQILIGRRDEKNNIHPDIDFADFGGFSLGVSRKHAEIRKLDNMYYILDVASANGTWLNDNGLVPFQPKELQSGDQIRVGQAVLSVRLVEDGEFVSISNVDNVASATIRLSANTEYDVFSENGVLVGRFGTMLSDYLQALDEVHALISEVNLTEKEEILVHSMTAPITHRTITLELTGAMEMFVFLKDVLKTDLLSEKSVKTKSITESILEDDLASGNFKQTDTIDTIPEPAKVADMIIKQAKLTINDEERIRYKAHLTRHLTTLFGYLLIPTAIKINL